MTSLMDVQRGYDDWATKPHNAKWVRKIDGTPIANDIVVCIFEAIKGVPSPALEAIRRARASLTPTQDEVK